MAGCNYQIATNVPMTKDRLREMLNIVENAEKHAIPGQSLMLEVNHNTTFVFAEIAKSPSLKGTSRDSESINT